MTLITWSDKYSIGISSIDLQHKKLADLINQLHAALSAGKAKEVQSKILSELIVYTKTHFTHEEKQLVDQKYPAYLPHKFEHDAFTKKVISFQKDLNSGKASISLELMDFLKDWLLKHINGTDKKYSQLLISKGVA